MDIIYFNDPIRYRYGDEKEPFISVRRIKALVFIVGCSIGPNTKDGQTVTILRSLFFAYSRASLSASVLARQ